MALNRKSLKLPRLKKWQWIVGVLVVLSALGNLVPEASQPTNGNEGTSPAWLLVLIPLVGVPLLVRNVIRKRRSAIEASKPSVSKYEQQIQELEDQLAFFGDHKNQFDELSSGGIVARRGENIIGVVSEVGLIESKTGPTQFRGGSSGVSFRVTKRISVRQSGMRGTATPGEDSPTVIDSGRFVISDQRAVFVGTKQSREFEWDKLLSFEIQELDKKNAILYLPVSNRQKVSGIAADTPSIKQIFQRVEFGVAVTTGRHDEFLDRIRNRIAQIRIEKSALENAVN